MNSEQIKAPWTDFVGNDVYAGDRIIHPSGEQGTVIFDAERPGTDSDKWLVDYGTGTLSRLRLQVGDKGLAIVLTHYRNKNSQRTRS